MFRRCGAVADRVTVNVPVEYPRRVFDEGVLNDWAIVFCRELLVE